jgi:hypothetical protein
MAAVSAMPTARPILDTADSYGKRPVLGTFSAFYP